MLDVLITILAFLLALSLLIAIHEFGHFWVARKLGVKVLRYSIGFGKPLWRHQSRVDGTEYQLASIPLGGYVKMLDEREGEVAEEDLPLAFNRQPVGKRFAIVAAGPAFNFLFAIAAYWLMFVSGVPGITPVLGELKQEGLAWQAGLREGQTILSVDGEQTPTWNAVFDSIIPQAVRKIPVDITVDDGGLSRSYTLALNKIDGEFKPETFNEVIGLAPLRPKIPAVIDSVSPDSPAEQAGLMKGDRITAIDGEAIQVWEQLVTKVSQSPGKNLRFGIERDGQPLELSIIPREVATKSGKVGKIGAGVYVDPALGERFRAEWQLGPVQGLGASLYKTWDMSLLTLQVMWEMLAGRASVENLSGPISIAVYAKHSAVAGFSQFLSFLAIVSVSLGVLNLLPIPILDGGHLMFYLIEMVKGSPISEQAEILGQKLGLMIILMLMMVAFYSDFTRFLG